MKLGPVDDISLIKHHITNIKTMYTRAVTVNDGKVSSDGVAEDLIQVPVLV